MDNVVLFFPKTGWDIPNVTTRLPLALLYVGTYLEKHGYRVKVIDQRVTKSWRSDLEDALRTNPLWVGVSSMTGRQIMHALEASRLVKEVAPSVPVVWGGVHPTIFPAQTVEHELIDLAVVGEGEETALELTQALAGRDGRTLDSVQSIAYKKDGQVHLTPLRPRLDMNTLPPLDYSFIRAEDYILTEVGGERSLQLTTSRGCPHDCAYCYITTIPFGRHFKAESPDRVVAQIERIQNEFGISSTNIIDDDFFANPKRVKAVCELILEKKLAVTVRTNTRVDYMDRMDMDLMRLVRQAGFKELYLGVESGSDRMLQFVKKRITREQVIRVNRKMAAAGIAPKFSFMGGFPSESTDEVQQTIDLMYTLTEENKRAYTTPIQLYSPYPGTELYAYCVEQGMALPTDLINWADSSWEKVELTWLTKKEATFLEKAAIFTFFLDGKTVAEALASRLHKTLARIYAWIVRKRCRRRFYAFMPETALIRRFVHSE